MDTREVSQFYVKIEDGANVTQIMMDLEAVAPFSFSSIESPSDEIESVFTSRMGQALLGTYSLNILYSIIYLTIGFSIVATIRGRNLRKQFSILRALGSSHSSITIPVIIDALITIILAGIIGILLGTILAYFLSVVPLFYMGNVTNLGWSTIPVRMVIPTVLFGGLMGTTIVFGLLSSYLVTKRILSRNIAEEIQYTE
jgi:ABC-type lipoprotein release transport system permease subunit